MKKIFIVLPLLVLINVGCKSQQSLAEKMDSLEMDNAQKTLFVIKESYLHPDKGVAYLDSLSGMYEQLMTALGTQEQSGIDTSQNQLSGRLYEIAQYKAERPELFTEIESVYRDQVIDPRRAALRSRALRSEHLGPEYGLVWEYYLLSPESRGTASFFEERALEAMVAVNQEAAVNTIAYLLHTSAESETTWIRYLGKKQRKYVETLYQIPAPKSLRTIINFMDLSEAQNKVRANDALHNPEKYIPELFLKNTDTELKGEWRKVLNTIPFNNFNQKQIQLINGLQ